MWGYIAVFYLGLMVGYFVCAVARNWRIQGENHNPDDFKP